MYIRNSKFPAQNSRERGRILLARSVSDSIRNSRKKFGTPFLSPSSTNDPKNRTRYTSAIGEQALFLEFHDFLNFSLIENLPEKRCKKSAIFWAHLRHLVSIKPSCSSQCSLNDYSIISQPLSNINVSQTNYT